MASFESVYVHAGSTELAIATDLVKQALVALRQPAVVRYAKGFPWIQVSALGDAAEDLDLRTRMKLRKVAPLQDPSATEQLAHRLSALIELDVTSLEAQTVVNYCAFSRFRAGAALRQYACCPEDPALVSRNIGQPEPWEGSANSAALGIQPRKVAAALNLPGFDFDQTWDLELQVTTI